MILAHPDVPAKTLPELVAYAKANPDKLQIATDGPRRFSGLIAAWINKLAGTEHLLCAVRPDDAGHPGRDLRARSAHHPRGSGGARAHRGGKLKALAVTSAKRLAAYPNVPTVAETFPGFDFAGWWVLAAPAGVPTPIVQRVNGEMSVVLKDPAVVEKMTNVGFISRGGGTLQQVRDYVAGQHAAWGTLVKEIGLQPE